MADGKRIMHVVGARPNFMKIAPILKEMDQYPEIKQILVHTGQHYDDKMSEVFFGELGIRSPDINLGVGSGSHAKQTAAIMSGFEPVLSEIQPDLVIVVGDVNSTLACSLTASKLNIPIAHVEAGLRSFDRSMPEEINRLITDALSSLLFTTSPEAKINLLHEGISPEKIFFVGNTMIDTLFRLKEKAKQTDILNKLGVKSGDFALATLHRPSNVNNRSTFKKILEAFLEIQKEIPLVFPVHPRTQQQIIDLGFENRIRDCSEQLIILEPVGYNEFLHLMMEAKVVLTDSGGIQEETTMLKIPCITIRENTERPITLTKGTNILVGTDPKRILLETRNALQNGRIPSSFPDLWDGKAAQRIVKIIFNWFYKD